MRQAIADLPVAADRGRRREGRVPTPTAGAGPSRPHGGPPARTSRSTSRCRRSPSPRSTCSTSRRPAHALDVVSVIEATLDDPRQVLVGAGEEGPRRGDRGDEGRGLRLRGAHGGCSRTSTTRSRSPSCSTAAFPTYRQTNPWVADPELSPKSVVRDMHERAMTFAEYRLVLRAGAHRGRAAALPRRRLPGPAPDGPGGGPHRGAAEIIEWLGELVRRTDSSLLDEWERLRHPDDDEPRRRPTPSPGSTPTTSPPGPSRATRGRSAPWSATRCSAASSWPRARTTAASARSTAPPAGTPTPGATALDPLLRRARRHRDRPGRPRTGAAARHRAARARPRHVGGPPGARRPGRGPRLAHRRRRRPRGERRGGRGRARGDGRGTPVGLLRPASPSVTGGRRLPTLAG